MVTTTTGAPKQDWLAIILIGCGSSFARGPDRQDCIDRVVRMAVSDWSSLFDLAGKEAVVNVYDVTGRSEVWWEARGVFSKEDAELGPVPQGEVVRTTFPTRRRRRAA